MDHDQFAGAIRQKTASQLTLNPPVCGPNTVVTVVTATEQDLGVYVGVYTCIYTFGVYTRVYWSKRSVYHKPECRQVVRGAALAGRGNAISCCCFVVVVLLLLF